MMWIFANLILWLIYFPLLTLLNILFFFVPKVRERRAFEKRNDTESTSRSFKIDGIRADLCFEFSSEGEYQQVASLIDDALGLGKRVELVFFSPSVEKTIMELAQKYPAQVRCFRYPILDLSFSSWVSASELILVRYDLFPEFLVWSLKKGRTLKFLWVTFKKERVAGKPVSLFKRAFLERSQFTVFASEADQSQGKDFSFEGPAYDFRMEQIRRRLGKKEEKFQRLFPLYPQFKQELQKFPREKCLILGNAWPSDLFLLENLPPDVALVVVPHQLKPEILNTVMAFLTKLGRKVEVITDDTQSVKASDTYLINKKGILCELYADFGKAYVGGGFETSIHSVLEPLVSGADSLSCGPIHHRSTEYDLALALDMIKEVRNSQDFLSWLKLAPTGEQVHVKLKQQIDSYAVYKKDVLSC